MSPSKNSTMARSVEDSPTLSGQHSPTSVRYLDLDDTVFSTPNTDAETTRSSPPSTSENDSHQHKEFFELNAPAPSSNGTKIENIMKDLFSEEHLQHILADHALFTKFSTFMNQYKPQMVPTLIRYLEMRKAICAVSYANAIGNMIRWPSQFESIKFSKVQPATVGVRFEEFARKELQTLCLEALPAFITHSLIEIVSECMTKDITGQNVPIMNDWIGNLAEVFCLTDPSLPDNPIIFASEEFHRTTQYGVSYTIDRNCRFLQGPETDRSTTARIARAIKLGQESNEILLNYRRDGTPFVNLLMVAPLYDDKGVIRYFIGAQIDVTGLVQEGLGIESFRSFLQNSPHNSTRGSRDSSASAKARETLVKLQELAQMFSQDESAVVARHSRSTSYGHSRQVSDDLSDVSSFGSYVPAAAKTRTSRRIILADDSLDANMIPAPRISRMGLPGVYKHYILVRPYPELQIIFVSPSLRLPGLLRTNIFSKIGGSDETLAALEDALRDGNCISAKVWWLPKHEAGECRPRYLRCTPLLGKDDKVGVWMMVLASPDECDPMQMSMASNDSYHSLSSLRMYGSIGSSGRRPSQHREVMTSHGIASRQLSERREVFTSHGTLPTQPSEQKDDATIQGSFSRRSSDHTGIMPNHGVSSGRTSEHGEAASSHGSDATRRQIDHRDVRSSLGSESDSSYTMISRAESRQQRRVVVIDHEETHSDADSGFDVRSAGRQRLRSPSERDLYAEYLRGSSSPQKARTVGTNRTVSVAE